MNCIVRESYPAKGTMSVIWQESSLPRILSHRLSALSMPCTLIFSRTSGFYTPRLEHERPSQVDEEQNFNY